MSKEKDSLESAQLERDQRDRYIEVVQFSLPSQTVPALVITALVALYMLW